MLSEGVEVWATVEIWAFALSLDVSVVHFTNLFSIVHTQAVCMLSHLAHCHSDFFKSCRD